MVDRLYGSLTSPYVRKLRLLAHEYGLALEFTEAGPRDEIVRKLNPIGKIPVLQAADGKVLYDSVVILDYLDRSGPKLIPADGPGRSEILCLEALTDGLIEAVIARLMETRRPAELQSASVLAHEEERIRRILAELEHAPFLGRTLTTGPLGLAAILVGNALSYMEFRYPHDWTGPSPSLAGLLRLLSLRPSFRDTAPPAGA